MKKFVTAFLPLVSIILFLITAEIAVRFYHYLRFNISFAEGQPLTKGGPSRLSPIVLDEELGWRPTENYRFDGKKHSSDGIEYSAKVSQDKNGFRMYGDISSGKPKILVIGDSFTQAVDTSDDKTYYAVVRDLLDVEVFAYGGGGYGSLQELMILDKYFDVIRPDLILWQYSTNDLVNNSPDLETASTRNNNGMPRPYWIDGNISYILPTRDSKGVRLFAIKYCRVCYMVLNRLDRLQAAIHGKTVETETSEGEPAYPTFLRAIRATDEIMEKVRYRAGSVPIVAFIVGYGSYGPEYENGLAEISRHHDIILLNDVEAAVLSAERKGTAVRAADSAHWNEVGHQIVGRAIVAGLRDILPPNR